MDTRADAAIVGPRILDSDGTIQGSARRFPGLTTAIAGRSSWLTKRFPNNPLSRHNLPALEHRAEPLDVDWVSGACMLVRRAAFEQIGGMDEHFFLYWEDADLCRRLQMQGWRSVYFPGATIVHAGGRSSIHAFRESLAAFHRSALLLFRKHARWPARLLLPAVYMGLQVHLRTLPLSSSTSSLQHAAEEPWRKATFMTEIDVVVIGAGVVGLACAAELAAAGSSVCVLERHPKPGMDTSTHNSGVIHAGIYYPEGSLKARLCVEGRDQLYEYCEQRQVPYRRTGKLIVASTPDEIPALQVLTIGAGPTA